MAKSQDAKKNVKKEPLLTPKEKKAAKRAKKSKREQFFRIFLIEYVSKSVSDYDTSFRIVLKLNCYM